jgi:hypothetical protein
LSYLAAWDVRRGRVFGRTAPKGGIKPGPTALVFLCETGPGQAIVYELTTGSMTTLPVVPAGDLAGVGRHWMAISYATDPMMPEHTSISYQFVNIATDEVLADSRRIGGSTYIDLNSPGLTRTACRPVSVPPTTELGVQAAGNLAFFGRVGVLLIGDGTGRVGIQRCGSSHIHSFRAYDLTFNSRVLLWPGDDLLQGLTEPQGRRFEVAVPHQCSYPALTSATLTDHALYLSGCGGQQSIYAATLPPTLR